MSDVVAAPPDVLASIIEGTRRSVEVRRAQEPAAALERRALERSTICSYGPEGCRQEGFRAPGGWWDQGDSDSDPAEEP